MLALGLDYLNGWAMATDPGGREAPEWPPHPDRVFMALAAAHFETGADPAEAAALAWLEEQAPPRLLAARHHPRDPVTHFVPVNDTGSPVGKGNRPHPVAGSLPLGRSRQPRSFPVAVPENPVVHLLWKAEPPAEHRRALAGLCRKLTAVGHSASLARAWLEETNGTGGVPPGPERRELVPVSGVTARHRLRVPTPGRLARLAADFEAGLRPASSLFQGYAAATAEDAGADEAPASVFEPNLVVLRWTGSPPAEPRLALETTLQVTHHLRRTVLSHCPDPPPEWVSGHGEAGPSRDPHVAFLPLADVDHEHATGRLLGVALALPRGVGEEEAERCLLPLLYDERGEPRPIPLTLGKLGCWTLELETGAWSRRSLRPESWTAAAPDPPAERWATVTPAVLDRHPKGEDPWAEVASTLAGACERIGLPRPVDVQPSPVSLFVGVPASRSFPRLARKRGGERRHTHAVFTFPEPVRGPLVVGAGRFRGYGLCRPYRGTASPRGWEEEGRS